MAAQCGRGRRGHNPDWHPASLARHSAAPSPTSGSAPAFGQCLSSRLAEHSGRAAPPSPLAHRPLRTRTVAQHRDARNQPQSDPRASSCRVINLPLKEGGGGRAARRSVVSLPAAQSRTVIRVGGEHPAGPRTGAAGSGGAVRGEPTSMRSSGRTRPGWGGRAVGGGDQSSPCVPRPHRRSGSAAASRPGPHTQADADIIKATGGKKIDVSDGVEPPVPTKDFRHGAHSRRGHTSQRVRYFFTISTRRRRANCGTDLRFSPMCTGLHSAPRSHERRGIS